ncbi:MAG TPA: AAA family ATPase, partial [Clostridia bacterium]|nr:AAA family ATPase [Clostridia bacterium]
MKLTRLEIYGFKSFPQRTDIRFDDGITGIVGPNGSGKSNIADAVRWVLGEQSAKALRGAKMEDVIFAGTQKRRLMPYCEVSLIFDNADGKLKSPHTEVMVTRRAYRSGEGEYYLNKKSCRLKDIVELFHDTGIGREGYSIIGQGHIDVILSGRGEERRAAFEEAAGIMGYRSRKEEAERKLNRTQEHLLRVGDLLEELGSRLQPLKEQSETARHYLELSARLKALDANIFISRHNRLDKRIAALQETQDGIRELLAGHEAELAACQLERQQADHDLALAEEESDRLSALLLKAEERLREQAVRAERGAQALQAAKEEAARNEESLHGLTAEITELSGLLAGSGEHISQYAQSLASADTALKELEETAASAQAAQNKLESALEAHRSRILQAANSRSDARERHARQQAMLSQAQERLQAVKGSEARLEEALELAKQGNAQAEERLAATRAQVSGLQEALKQAEERLNSRRESFRTAEEAIQERRLANQRDRARLNTMEEVARSHEGFFQPARQALLYGQNNQKVHGAVAHLLSVPEHL